VPITTNVVSSNPSHGKVYSIQHYLIKFVSHLRQAGGFLRVLPVSSTNKTDRHDITEILLKVALNTITLISSIISYHNLLSGFYERIYLISTLDKWIKVVRL